MDIRIELLEDSVSQISTLRATVYELKVDMEHLNARLETELGKMNEGLLALMKMVKGQSLETSDLTGEGSGKKSANTVENPTELGPFTSEKAAKNSFEQFAGLCVDEEPTNFDFSKEISGSDGNRTSSPDCSKSSLPVALDDLPVTVIHDLIGISPGNCGGALQNLRLVEMFLVHRACDEMNFERFSTSKLPSLVRHKRSKSSPNGRGLKEDKLDYSTEEALQQKLDMRYLGNCANGKKEQKSNAEIQNSLRQE
ncbi:Hypothetical predicted protein, partial [Olea europaea subsp. europaea]